MYVFLSIIHVSCNDIENFDKHDDIENSDKGEVGNF